MSLTHTGGHIVILPKKDAHLGHDLDLRAADATRFVGAEQATGFVAFGLPKNHVDTILALLKDQGVKHRLVSQ